MSDWSISAASTAISTATITPPTGRTGVLKGASWSLNGVGTDTSVVFSVLCDGTSVVNGAGVNSINDMCLPFTQTVEARWPTTTTAIHAYSVWGDWV